MRSIGVRELKQHTSQILRQVRERGEEIQLTYRGRVFARLIPITPTKSTVKKAAAVWSDLDRLAAEIRAHWPADVTATEAVREGRREL